MKTALVCWLAFVSLIWSHPAPKPSSLEVELPGEWFMQWGGGTYRACFTADGGYHWHGCGEPFSAVEYTMTSGGWRVLSREGNTYQIAAREGHGWYRWELTRSAEGWSGKFWRAEDQAGKPVDNAWRELRLQPLHTHPEWIKFAAGALP